MPGPPEAGVALPTLRDYLRLPFGDLLRPIRRRTIWSIRVVLFLIASSKFCPVSTRAALVLGRVFGGEPSNFELERFRIFSVSGPFNLSL